jgi:hypothetical protein
VAAGVSQGVPRVQRSGATATTGRGAAVRRQLVRTHSLTHLLTYTTLSHTLTHTHRHTHTLTHISLTYDFIHEIIPALTHSLTPSLAHSLIGTYSSHPSAPHRSRVTSLHSATLRSPPIRYTSSSSTECVARTPLQALTTACCGKRVPNGYT